MSDTPPATPSHPTPTPRGVPAALSWALCAVLLLGLPRAWQQGREQEALSQRGRPFWMLPAYPALLAQLDGSAAEAPALILFSDRKGRDHRQRLFGLQFHAAPASVRDVRTQAEALAALRAGQPVLVDLSDAEASAAVVAQLLLQSDARTLRVSSSPAHLLAPAEPSE